MERALVRDYDTYLEMEDCGSWTLKEQMGQKFEAF